MLYTSINLGAVLVKEYEHALTLLREAIELMDRAGNTLIAAHIATPIDAIEVELTRLRGAAA